MTSDNDNALDDSDHELRTPVLRRVIRPGVDGRRRSELNELIDRVLPDRTASADELWMGDGPARPMSIPDLELLCALEAEGFDGFVWSELENRLAGYGFGVIGAWLASGVIYPRSAEKGRPVRPPRPSFTRDEQMAVVSETVAEGIRLFRRDGLEKDGWRPDRGARLSTYFLGSCVLCFANVCRKEVSSRRRCEQEVFVSDYGFDDGAVPSAERVALAKMDVDFAIGGDLGKLARIALPPDVVRVVLHYLIIGFEVTEVLELINTETVAYKAKAVRAVRSAYRAYIKEQQREGGQHG
ncbi:hypothetical protein [Amycolatopsis tolypomycina]|uniref:hypothetical protein n=1 Tax=Amycolatopsis tolypomycina TaxID=208445 RepID=UPI0033B9CD3F